MGSSKANVVSKTKETAYLFVGEMLCVDFANTVYSQEPGEGAIGSWRSLLGFLKASGMVDERRFHILCDLEVSAAGAVNAAYRGAIKLRDAIREAVVCLSEKRPAPPQSVEEVNRVLRYTLGYEQLLADGGGWRLRYVEAEKRLEWLLAPIARSAAELIAEGSGAPVRKCGRPECILYFYDRSRTGKRRWCQMAVCGNRAKVAAFVKRKRKVDRA